MAVSGTANVIVAANIKYVSGSEFDEAILVVRLSQDGTLDRAFGKSGIAELPIPRVINALVGLSVSRLSIAVSVQQVRAFGVVFALVGSLAPDGQLNKDFGGGIVYAPTRDYIYGNILAHKDGKVFVAGRSSSNNALLTARYSKDGSLDAQYGNNGFFEYSLGEGTYMQALGLA